MSELVLRRMLVVALFAPVVMAGCGSTNRAAPVFDRAPPPRDTPAVESRTTGERQSAATSQSTTAAGPGAAQATNATRAPLSDFTHHPAGYPVIHIPAVEFRRRQR